MSFRNNLRKTLKWTGYSLIGLFFFSIIALATVYFVQTSPLFYTNAATTTRITWNELPTPTIQLPNWETFSSTQNVNDVVVTNSLLWVATDGGLVVVDQRESNQFVQFHPEHGLPSNRLSAIDASTNGEIWVGTRDSGIGRYDGSSWERFTTDDGLVSNVINDLLVDSRGTVWAASDAGLMRFDGQRWRLVRFSLVDFSPPAVRQVMEASNGIWVGSEIGIFYFDGSTWTYFGLEDGVINADIRSLGITTDGRILAGTPSGLAVFDGTSWDRITVKDGFDDFPFEHVAGGPSNSIFVAYGGEGQGQVVQYDGLTVSSLPSLPPTIGKINRMLRLGNENIFGTDVGLYFQGASGVVRGDLPESFPSQTVNTLVEADDGVWVSGSQGVSYYGYDSSEWTTQDFGPVSSMVNTEDNRLAIAFEHPSDGILLVDPETGESTPIYCRTAGLEVGFLFNAEVTSDGKIWFLGNESIEMYDDNRWETVVDGLPVDYTPRKILVDADDQLWLGLEEGIYRLNREINVWELVDTNAVLRMAAHPTEAGTFWVGTELGIAYYHAGQLSMIPPPPLRDLTRGFVANEDGLWISSEDGIAHYDGTSWQRYTMDNGLPTPFVTTLNTDPKGQVWAGFVDERFGFAKYDKETDRWKVVHNIVVEDDPNSGHETEFLPRRDRVMNISISEDEEIWFGTYFGKIGRVTEDELRYRPRDYRLYWSSIRSILITPDDSIWLAGWEGRLARYLPDQDRWEIYDSELAGATVRDIVPSKDADASDAYWLGTDLGVVEFTPDTCQFVPFEDQLSIVSGEVDPNSGNIWWATNNYGGASLDVESATLSYPIRQLKGRRFADVEKGVDDAFWFVSYDELVRVFDGQRQVFLIDDTVPTVASVGIGPDFRPWLGTQNGIFFQAGRDWVSLTTEDGLAGNSVVDIHTAQDGSVWILTDGGVSRFTP